MRRGADAEVFLEHEQFRNQLLHLDAQLGFDRTPPETLVFSDESGTHGGSRYFGLGALFVWHNSVTGKKFRVDLDRVCVTQQWTDEFKWSKVSKGNLHRYERLVDMFFSAPKTVRFHCIVADRSRFVVGDSQHREVLFKFYHLLLAHRLKPRSVGRTNRRVILIPDDMEIPWSYWSSLCWSVNSHLKKQFDVRHSVITECIPTSSGKVLELQLADILLGAVLADHQRDLRSSQKKGFAEKVRQRIEAIDDTKASIWRWRP